MKPVLGELINAEKAQEYFDAQAIVQNGRMAMLKPEIELTAAEKSNIKMAQVYNSSPKNAFVFDKQIVLDLLTKEDKNGNVADYLMIHFAAKLNKGDGFKKGEPTVVILGCNIKTPVEINTYNKGVTKAKQVPKNSNVFTSMAMDDSAAEHPGGSTNPVFPTTGNKMNGVEMNVMAFVIK